MLTSEILASVLGIIAIPGMMTGAILGGSSVEQAARLQMVIMFMISSCTALASIVTTVLALSVVVDSEHRIRSDRVDARQHVVYRARDQLVARVVVAVEGAVGKGWRGLKRWLGIRGDGEERQEAEREMLLGHD